MGGRDSQGCRGSSSLRWSHLPALRLPISRLSSQVNVVPETLEHTLVRGAFSSLTAHWGVRKLLSRAGLPRTDVISPGAKCS